MADSSSVGIDGQGYLYIIMDSDGDGVIDSKDLCPNTPVGESVDSDGCSSSQKILMVTVLLTIRCMSKYISWSNVDSSVVKSAVYRII